MKRRVASAQEVFGRNLRNARQRACLTQEELAQRTNIVRTTITAIEMGRQNVTIETIQRLADGLRLKAFDLMDDI